MVETLKLGWLNTCPILRRLTIAKRPVVDGATRVLGVETARIADSGSSRRGSHVMLFHRMLRRAA